jgi:hypothetical protein
MNSQKSSRIKTTGQLDDQTMAQLGMKDESSERNSATYEGHSPESEADFGQSADSEGSSTIPQKFHPLVK